MLPTTTEPLVVRFFIDNTSVVALHNKSSQSGKINKLALESREILQAKQYVASWSWIPSFSNFAGVHSPRVAAPPCIYTTPTARHLARITRHSSHLSIYVSGSPPLFRLLLTKDWGGIIFKVGPVAGKLRLSHHCKYNYPLFI
jgi:hypothetical protein